MKIQKITLTNFRIYEGQNTVSFDGNSHQNISLIAGRNGFGKTTFLTSLIWGFYGKMISEVEDKYRTDIRNAGGYDKFLKTLLNRTVRTNFEQKSTDQARFSVEIKLNDIAIPSIPCESVVISRSFDLKTNQEELKIYIDGLENELTKEVGYEVFINDFILPREIAKFFFFDAEKIVSLAEAKSHNELKNLSRAYSEVLGIKKYEDLKRNLEMLISKLKRDGATQKQQTKLITLFDDQEQLEGQIELNEDNLRDIESELHLFKIRSEGIQEKLIREGNAITLEELLELKREQEELKHASLELKSKLRKLLDIAPLVIAGPALLKLKEQVDAERHSGNITIHKTVLLDELRSFSSVLLENLDALALDESLKGKLEAAIQKQLSEKETLFGQAHAHAQVLVDFSEEQFRNFEAVLSHIKSTFANQFEAVVQEEKINRSLLNRAMQKIKQAEARKDNPLVQRLRDEKKNVDAKLEMLQTDKGKLLAEIDNYKQRLASTRKVLSEYEKDLSVAAMDDKKHEVAVATLEKINAIIKKIKEDKKYALQKSVLLGLNKIMHKDNFVYDVRVNVQEDIMDIDLLDQNGQIIDKDSLSKGEQQLYATALLKALVDESGIKFPVFIDSPLQKFDKLHSRKIIQEFYPAISEQVVLFPLLEKELSEAEYEYLKPNINKVYLIENREHSSTFRQVDAANLFQHLKQEDHVHAD
ncbi:MAG: DNA sulfur modification protein DndD [Bacteroidota bacterium]